MVTKLKSANDDKTQKHKTLGPKLLQNFKKSNRDKHKNFNGVKNKEKQYNGTTQKL